jgi:galactokinase
MEDLERRQKRKEAAYQFVEALTKSYGANIDFIAAQKNNAEITQRFFEAVIEELRERGQAARRDVHWEELECQEERRLKAAQALGHESTGAYVDFLGSLFFYCGSRR